MAETGFAERAALVQREMVDTVRRLRPAKARTLATFKAGTRSKEARLAGLQIPFWKNFAHGSGLNAPTQGNTSFKKSIKEEAGAMYAGVAFRYMNMWLEATVLRDMERGYIPDSYIKERQRRIETYQMKKNWAAIGKGTGSIAVVSSCNSSNVLTCVLDRTARGRSKGSFRLKESVAADPLWYEAYDPADDSLKARFYVTSKGSATTATVVFDSGYSYTDLNVADLEICERDQWKMEMIGIGGHISDENRLYQGVNTADHPYLKNVAYDAGNAAPTPSMVHAAKGIMVTRANTDGSEIPFVAHTTHINYRKLAAFGYSARAYQINDKVTAKNTYGLPRTFIDEDTEWICDADYEEAYIDFREKMPYFEYVQKPFGLHETGGQTRHEWIGANQAGSTNQYENYTENTNIVWDGRGAEGDKDGGGSPNSAVSIKNIAVSSTDCQAAYGV